MINFFRKIRRQNLAENKTGKYIKYAIGEILLVVIGILIALQVNNWNEERAKEIALQAHLKNLVEDLNQDIGSLSAWSGVNEFRFYAMQYLLTISGYEPNYFPGFQANKDFVPDEIVSNLWEGKVPTEFNEEFVKVAIKSMDFLSEIYPNKSALEELKDDGLYSYIEDPTVKNAMTSYYFWLEFNLGTAENTNARKYKNDWTDAMNSMGFHPENIRDSKEIIHWLKNSPQSIAKLRNLASNAKWKFESSKTLAKDAKALTEVINTYLNTR